MGSRQPLSPANVYCCISSVSALYLKKITVAVEDKMYMPVCVCACVLHKLTYPGLKRGP